MDGSAVSIVLVEDDEVDTMAIKRAFRKHKIANPIHHAENGKVALALLRGEAGHSPVRRPFLILLDLNMPQMTGLEFLDELRQDTTLADAIVFVLTTSDDETDKKAAYARHVAGYIVKERVATDFADLLTLLDGYWCYVDFPSQQALTLE